MATPGHSTPDDAGQERPCAAKIPFFKQLSTGVQNAIITELQTRETNTDEDDDNDEEDHDSEEYDDSEQDDDNDNDNDSDRDNYVAAADDDDAVERKTLASTILAVFDAHDSLEVMDKFLLSASFNSLLRRRHGIKDQTAFNIVSLTIESAQVAAKVRTDHKPSVEILAPVQEFDDMLCHNLEEYYEWEPCQDKKTDEIPSKRARYNEFIAEITGANIQSFVDYTQSSVEIRTIQCWCCSREITYSVIVRAATKEHDTPAPIVGKRKRSPTPTEMQTPKKVPKHESLFGVAKQK